MSWRHPPTHFQLMAELSRCSGIIFWLNKTLFQFLNSRILKLDIIFLISLYFEILILNLEISSLIQWRVGTMFLSTHISLSSSTLSINSIGLNEPFLSISLKSFHFFLTYSRFCKNFLGTLLNLFNKFTHFF